MSRGTAQDNKHYYCMRHSHTQFPHIADTDPLASAPPSPPLSHYSELFYDRMEENSLPFL